MLISNRHDLPDAYHRACSERRVPQVGRISTTEMLQPPQLRGLTLRHHAGLTQDCADMIWMFFGTAVHAALEHSAPKDHIVEQKMEWRDPASGWVVHGTPDALSWTTVRDGLVTDWKTTMVRGLKYDKPEWEAQANVYAHLARLNGYSITGVVVWAFLRDFDPRLRGDDYPAAPVCRVDVPLWDAERAHTFLLTRLALHQAAAEGQWEDCTPEERWKRSTYALWSRKPDAKRATRVFPTLHAAEAYAEAVTERPKKWKDWFEVEERGGEALRCIAYCPVSNVCSQWGAEKAQMELAARAAAGEAPVLTVVQ